MDVVPDALLAKLGSWGRKNDARTQERGRKRVAAICSAWSWSAGLVDLLIRDATEVVASLPGSIDFVIFDADRINASDQIELLIPKLAPDAVLLACNMLSHPEEVCGYLVTRPRPRRNERRQGKRSLAALHTEGRDGIRKACGTRRSRPDLPCVVTGSVWDGRHILNLAAR